jgi:hypothetical protein
MRFSMCYMRTDRQKDMAKLMHFFFHLYDCARNNACYVLFEPNNLIV